MSKPIPAIVESQHEAEFAAVRATFSALREADVQAEKADKRAEAARGAAAMRRIECGRALMAVRKIWPSRGPNAKGWGEYLAKEGIEQSTAWNYMKLAGHVGDEFSPADGETPTYADVGIDRRPRLVPPPPPDTDFDPVPQPPAALPRPGFDLRLGDWRSALIGEGMVDALITDPPYGERTHRSNFRERADGHDVAGLRPDFAAWTPADVQDFVRQWAPRTRGWIVALTSHDLAPAWEAAYEAAGRYAFAPVPCVIQGMSVRMAGDGPSSWTVYAMVARPTSGAFSRWGTLPGAYVGGRQPGAENGRGKPGWLLDRIVRDYTRANDLVCDPMAGYGSTLISAIDAGRRAIGSEIDHDAYDEAHRRAARPRATDDESPSAA